MAERTVTKKVTKRQFIQYSLAAALGAGFAAITPPLPAAGAPPTPAGEPRPQSLEFRHEQGEIISRALSPDARFMHINEAGVAFIQQNGNNNGTVSTIQSDGNLTVIERYLRDFAPILGTTTASCYEVRDGFGEGPQLYKPYDIEKPGGFKSKIGPCGNVKENSQISPVLPMSNEGIAVHAVTTARELQPINVGGGLTNLNYLTGDTGELWNTALTNFTNHSLRQLDLTERANASSIQEASTLFDAVSSTLSDISTIELFEIARKKGFLRKKTIANNDESNTLSPDKKRQSVLEDIARIPFINRTAQELRSQLNDEKTVQNPKALSLDTRRKQFIALGLELDEELTQKLQTDAQLMDDDLKLIAIEFAALSNNIHTTSRDNVIPSNTFWYDRPSSNFHDPEHGTVAIGSNGKVRGDRDAILSARVHSFPEYNSGAPVALLQVRTLTHDEFGYDLEVQNPDYVMPPNGLEPFGTRDIKLVLARGREGGAATYAFGIQGTNSNGDVALTATRWTVSGPEDVYPTTGKRKVDVDGELPHIVLGNDSDRKPEEQLQLSVTSYTSGKYQDIPLATVFDPLTRTFTTRALWRYAGEQDIKGNNLSEAQVTSVGYTLPTNIQTVYQSQIRSDQEGTFIYMLVDGIFDESGEVSKRVYKKRIDMPEEPIIPEPLQKEEYKLRLPMIIAKVVAGWLGLGKKDTTVATA